MEQTTVVNSTDPAVSPTTSQINTSGQGKDAIIPNEIKGWNWGAFGFNWIWGIGNETYLALLGLIPLVNIVMSFILGAKGNEWAWRNRRWDSIEHFKKVQKIWARVWWGWLGLFSLVFLIGTAFLIGVTTSCFSPHM